MYKYKAEQENTGMVPGNNQDNIYSRASEKNNDKADESPDAENKENKPRSFWEWLKKVFQRRKDQCWDGQSGKGNKKFRHKKVLLLPQLEITRKKIATDHEDETFHIDIPYKINTNTPEDRHQALEEVKETIKNERLRGRNVKIIISGSTPGNLENDHSNGDYTIDGATVPKQGNLTALVDGRANVLRQLLIESGIKRRNIEIGPPIFNATGANKFAAQATIIRNNTSRSVESKVKWKFKMVRVGKGFTPIKIID